MKKLKDFMVLELNLELEKLGIELRYELMDNTGKVRVYRLTIKNKFLGEYVIPPVTKEFEELIRKFFVYRYEVTDTGYSNSVSKLVTWEEN